MTIDPEGMAALDSLNERAMKGADVRDAPMTVAPPVVRPVHQLGVRVEDELYHQMKIRAAQMGLRDWEVWEAAAWTWLKQWEGTNDG